jgi:integration host factor subunit alpha
MAITKADIAHDIFEQAKISKKDSVDLTEVFFEVIAQALENGEAVRISGFGNFECAQKRARPGRNPRTKEPVPISARFVVTYKPSQKVKERIESIDSKIVEVSKRRDPSKVSLEEFEEAEA